jgi:2-keto-3-deoxy-L-rhamnonate aldolase RhmA
MSNDFLDDLRAGEPRLMLGIRGSRTTDIVRVARATGHHAVLVDLEHSTMSLDVASELCSAAYDLGLVPFVRTPEREYGAIGRLLDGGALGIVAPRIETVEEAETVVRACRFPPRGQRSQLASVPMTGMRPTPAKELNPMLDAATIVKVLIETPLGVANADAIAAIDGVDVLALGANDLTAELGIPGQYDHPLVRDAVAAMAEACRKHGRLLMIGGIADPLLYAELAELGACPLLLTGMDTDLLFAAVQARADAVLEASS